MPAKRPDVLIPLFPLPMVVGPGEPVALHIFEERYKKLMRDIRASGALKHVLAFGIALYDEKKQEVSGLGCTILLEKIVKTYPDGRMDVVGRGRRIFEITGLDRTLPYARAYIRFVLDDEEEIDLPLLADTQDAVHQLLSEARGSEPDLSYDPAYPASYQWAHDAGLDPGQKYKLLVLRSENERLAFLKRHCRKAARMLKKAKAIRERVMQNGHFREFPEIKF